MKTSDDRVDTLLLLECFGMALMHLKARKNEEAIQHLVKTAEDFEYRLTGNTPTTASVDGGEA